MRNPALLAGAGILLMQLALATEVRARTAVPSVGFSPPEAPLVLTRTVRRELPDGRVILVARDYAIKFRADTRGFVVEGRLLDCRVDVPEGLKALAEIERRRPDEGLFPLTLDKTGMILSGGNAQGGLLTRQAARVASSLIGGKLFNTDERQAAEGFVAQLGRAPAGSLWPVDLFSPQIGRHIESRTIPLANGMEGKIEVTVDAERSSDNTVLSRLRRSVVTELADTKRHSLEEWTLVAAR